MVLPKPSVLLATLVFGCSHAGPAPPAAGTPGTLESATWDLVPDWPRIPPELVLVDVSDVALDSRGHVLLLHRAGRVFNNEGLADTTTLKEPVIVELDAASGRVVRTFGAGSFLIPHSLTVDRQDNLWITDVGRQQVVKLSHEGTPLLTVGEWRVAGVDGRHFDLPTDIVVADDGSFHVSDGYRNSRVAHFDAAGRYLGEWGTPGSGPGQFQVPHGLARDGRGNFYVADRQNFRLQVFDSSGRFLRQWPAAPDSGRVFDVAVSASGVVYLARSSNPDALTILDSELQPVGRIPFDPVRPFRAHGIAVQGDSVIYVAAGNRRVLKLVRR